MQTGVIGRLAAIHDRIAKAENKATRPPGTVQLIAVSKTQPSAIIREAYEAGQRHFGENYLQEALEKMWALADLPDITWHFIGPIQTNKTRQIAASFNWVHTLDRLRIAERLSQQRPAGLPPLNVCIQVNISGEDTKSGVLPDQLAALARAVVQLPQLRLRGLMAIPAPCDNPDRQRLSFHALHNALNALAMPQLDTLSMGMSADLESAIQEGATHVRIGTALFGARTT